MFFSSFGAFRTLPDATGRGDHLPSCAKAASLPDHAQQFFKSENTRCLHPDEASSCADKQSGRGSADWNGSEHQSQALFYLLDN